MRKVRVAAVQFEHTDGDKAANLQVIDKYTAAASAEGVEIVVFPECCVTGYWFLRNLPVDDLRNLAEPVPGGPTTTRLLEIARRHGLTVGAGFVESTPDGVLYNIYVVAMPDGRWARHRKLHCFVSPHMASGDAFTVFDTPAGCRVGVLTCYDNNLVENARATALAGAEVILAPHQTGGCDTGDAQAMGLVDPDLWERRTIDPEPVEAEFRGEKGRGWLLRWLPSRAHDNGVFYVFSNGVGRDDNEIRTGNAMILDTYGRVLAETWHAGNAMVTAVLDPALRANNSGMRWISARRPELYKPLTVPTGREVDIRTARFKGVRSTNPKS